MADEPKVEGKPKPAAAAPPAPKPPAGPTVTPWENDLTQRLKEAFEGGITEFCTYIGQDYLVAQPGVVIPVLEYLRFEEDFDYLVDITAVDYPERPERFDLVYVLYSFARNQRVRVKTRIKEGDKVETAVSVHLTADWLEREVYDMFGIEFEGHPNLRRILMPDDWEGFPLRKDYGIYQMDNRWVKENLSIESGQ